MSASNHVFPTPIQGATTGISLRDYFAAQAMSGMLAAVTTSLDDATYERIAYSAYETADAMVRVRESKK